MDESATQENFEDKIKDAIEGLSQKRYTVYIVCSIADSIRLLNLHFDVYFIDT